MTEEEEEVRARFAEQDRESAESAERWIERMGLEGDEAESFRNHSKKWILIDGEPVPVGLFEWAMWNEHHPEQKIVGRDVVVAPGGREFRVSTVFLGLDHGYRGGPPILFETMIFDDIRIGRRLDRFFEKMKEKGWAIFGGDEDEPYVEPPSIKYDGWQMRYATLAEAKAGHDLTVRMVKDGLEDWGDDD